MIINVEAKHHASKFHQCVKRCNAKKKVSLSYLDVRQEVGNCCCLQFTFFKGKKHAMSNLFTG